MRLIAWLFISGIISLSLFSMGSTGVPSPEVGHLIVENSLELTGEGCDGEVAMVYGLRPLERPYQILASVSEDCVLMLTWLSDRTVIFDVLDGTLVWASSHFALGTQGEEYVRVNGHLSEDDESCTREGVVTLSQTGGWVPSGFAYSTENCVSRAQGNWHHVSGGMAILSAWLYENDFYNTWQAGCTHHYTANHEARLTADYCGSEPSNPIVPHNMTPDPLQNFTPVPPGAVQDFLIVST